MSGALSWGTAIAKYLFKVVASALWTVHLCTSVPREVPSGWIVIVDLYVDHGFFFFSPVLAAVS